MKRMLLAMAIIAIGFQLGACAEKKSNAKPEVVRTHAMTATVTVEKIDREKRLVTVKGPDGNIEDIEVDESVGNLQKLKVGDQVVIDYLESIAASAYKKGEKPMQPNTGGVQISADSAARSIKMVGTAEITAKVISIDQKTRKVVLEGSNGEKREITVKPDVENLHNLKKDDMVVFTVTHAAALSIKPVQAKP